jgi:hypothetical protein
MTLMAGISFTSNIELTKRKHAVAKSGSICENPLEELWQIRVDEVPHTLRSAGRLHQPLHAPERRSDWNSVVAGDCV